MAQAIPPCRDGVRALYLDLMKRTLTNWVYADSEVKPVPAKGMRRALRQALVTALSGRKTRLVRPCSFDPQRRSEGRDWPSSAHTMIGLKRLDNLQACVETVLRNGVPGDLIETGVWRGGASIFMRAILKVYGVTDRCVWLADSFAGLPPPQADEYPHDAGSRAHEADQLAVPQERVEANFERYGLLDGQVRFLKGWFRDTLPEAPIDRLALIRLDGDLYESTMDALTSLFPKLSIGGYVIVDDYGALESCRQAVHDYRAEHGITDEILPIDWTGAYWRRTK